MATPTTTTRQGRSRARRRADGLCIKCAGQPHRRTDGQLAARCPRCLPVAGVSRRTPAASGGRLPANGPSIPSTDCPLTAPSGADATAAYPRPDPGPLPCPGPAGQPSGGAAPDAPRTNPGRRPAERRRAGRSHRRRRCAPGTTGSGRIGRFGGSGRNRRQRTANKAPPGPGKDQRRPRFCPVSPAIARQIAETPRFALSAPSPDPTKWATTGWIPHSRPPRRCMG